MKKAVITILGLAGGKIDKSGEAINFKSKHKYYFNKEDNLPKYSNTLPLLIDKYSDNYDIVPLFTKEAKLVQEKILKESENKEDFLNIFNEANLIKNENDFDALLSLISNTIEKYNKVIVDITHGFRHMPIMATINLIMENIKDIDKVEHIWFAKEIIKAEPGIEGEYHLIDLKKYLDLASLSFIIKNFKDNYTISSTIKISDNRYKELLVHLNQFSKDIMALSTNNLFYKTYPKLNSILEKMKNDPLLSSDLITLQKELEIFKYHNYKRYKLYYKLAENLNKKEYLLQAIALIAEAKGFYIKSSIKSISQNIYNYIENIEIKIENEENYNRHSKYTYYQLNQECKKIYSNTLSKILNDDYFFNKNFYYIKDKNILKEIKESMNFNRNFKDFIWHDLRNQLVHANSIENIENAKNLIDKEIQKFKQYCIVDNILNCKSI